MFGVKAKKKEFEAQSDTLRARISELYLRVKSGSLTPKEEERVKGLLKRLEAQNAGSRGDTERRVRGPSLA